VKMGKAGNAGYRGGETFLRWKERKVPARQGIQGENIKISKKNTTRMGEKIEEEEKKVNPPQAGLKRAVKYKIRTKSR